MLQSLLNNASNKKLNGESGWQYLSVYSTKTKYTPQYEVILKHKAQFSIEADN